MKQKRMIAVACCTMLLLAGCAGSGQKTDNPAVTASPAADSPAVTTEPAPLEERSLVTLGDSIAFGYGMEDPDTERYSAIVCAALSERDGISWHDYNYALSGDDSSDLLWRLDRGRAKYLPSSDIIIINIGSNNLLGVYSDFVKDKVDYEDLDLDSLTDEQISQMQSELEEALADEEAVRQEIAERTDEKLALLESDLADIYAWIRDKNEDAEIYVLNIYNPYRGIEDAGMPGNEENFGEYAQTQIDRANAILTAFTDQHSDLIPVDIAKVFAETDPIPVVGKTDAELPIETDSESLLKDIDYFDPHPTKEGQKLIADTILERMNAAS